MPPKAKFSKDEIIQMAFQIAKTDGIDKITARELGTRLGSSARPIFTVFENMDQIRAEVIACGKELYRQYVTDGLQQEIAFKGVGMAYITFSIREPKLFQLLFMSAGSEQTDVAHILPQIDASYEEILHSVQIPYGLSRAAADRMYQHLWTYTHGIATMCATGLCNYTMEQISDRLTEIFKSLLMMEKGAYQNHDKN
ncbi:MAG: WHG domain-containing protein [Lachnospiraceae bacterium]|nr:WHG domain-containing protein [Lachnospiraceae bacterium]